MEPYKVKKLPIGYKIDKNLMILLAEASAKYGEYKAILNTLEFEAELFLQSVLRSDSYKSTQIEGTQISHEDIFSLDIIEENDDSLEIKNLTKSIEYATIAIKEKGITMNLVNEMHRIILNSGRGSTKVPGKIRDTQNWIGPRGAGKDQATFIPPSPDDVIEDLINLYEYMNDAYIDPVLVNVAISHAQFETIHPYNDGNGRLGRALIPIQMAYLSDDRPMLYLSEIIEVNKLGYQRALMNTRRGNLESFITFFMQCTIDQCSNYIRKLEIIKNIYKEDTEKIKSIKGSSIHTVFPLMMNKVVFTKQYIENQTDLAPSTIARIINQLLDLGILVDISRGRKKEYRYDRIYKVFIGTETY
ncbi:MAG: Fic family protein [Peptostreptococcaceae bacterium]